MKLLFLLFASCVVSTLSHSGSRVQTLTDHNRELVLIGGNYYFISTITAPFLEATLTCNDLGLKLISIQNEEKQLKIANYLSKNGHGNEYFLTSGVKVLRTDLDVYFMWSGTGQVFDYTNWYSQGYEPDNDYGYDIDVCVGLYTETEEHRWEDRSCTFPNQFICEEMNKVDLPPTDEKLKIENTREMANINGTDYFISDIVANFFDAATHCNDIGMKLLSIKSEAKQMMFADYLTNNGHAAKNFYTSGQRTFSSTFMWCGIGQVFGYTNWYVDGPEPNEPYVLDVCMRLLNSTYSYQWEDLDCSTESYFICEPLDMYY